LIAYKFSNTVELTCDADLATFYCGNVGIYIYNELLEVEHVVDGSDLFTVTREGEEGEIIVKMTHALQFGLHKYTFRAFLEDYPQLGLFP